MTRDELIEGLAKEIANAVDPNEWEDPSLFMVDVRDTKETSQDQYRQMAIAALAFLEAQGWGPRDAVWNEAIEAAAEASSRASWRHEGEDAHSKGMDRGAREQAKACYDAIHALKREGNVG